MAEPVMDEELAVRNAEHEPEYLLRVNEAQAREIMTGTVPDAVKEMARMLVDWTLETGPLDYVGRRKTRPRRR